MAIVEDVAKLLNDSGNFGSLGVNIFGYEWGNVDSQILVMTGISVPSDLKDLYLEEAVQILVRGNKSESAKYAQATAAAIYEYLVGLSESNTVNGVEYKGFEPTSNIAQLGKDEDERHVFSLNFDTYRGLS